MHSICKKQNLRRVHLDITEFRLPAIPTKVNADLDMDGYGNDSSMVMADCASDSQYAILDLSHVPDM